MKTNKKSFNYLFITIITLLQLAFQVILYLKNKIYLTSSSSLTANNFSALRTYDTLSRAINVITIIIIIGYIFFTLNKQLERKSVLTIAIINLAIIVETIICYLALFQNIYYTIILAPICILGILEIILLFKYYSLK